MNKKEYIKPKSKHIVIAGAPLLAGSDGDVQPPVITPGMTNDDGNNTTDGKFSLWEDED